MRVTKLWSIQFRRSLLPGVMKEEKTVNLRCRPVVRRTRTFVTKLMGHLNRRGSSYLGQENWKGFVPKLKVREISRDTDRRLERGSRGTGDKTTPRGLTSFKIRS